MSCELTPIQVNDDILDAVASGSYYSPHSVLGAHLGEAGVTVRTMARLADAVDIITPPRAPADRPGRPRPRRTRKTRGRPRRPRATSTSAP